MALIVDYLNRIEAYRRAGATAALRLQQQALERAIVQAAEEEYGPWEPTDEDPEPPGVLDLADLLMAPHEIARLREALADR